MATVTLFLCCLLGSISLVYGQPLIRLAASSEPDGTDHTGEIISFSDVGSGANGLPRPWFCYTEDTGSVLWLFPNGSALQLESRVLAVQDEVFIRDVPNFGVALYRGPTHFSPDGEHCCVRTATNERRCVTFTPCPTLSPLSNGTISYDADTNMATYTCDPGYAVTTISSITCNDVTMMWSSTVRPTCELSTTTCSDLTAPTNGMIGYNAETMNTRPVNTVATFTCKTGYTVTGDMTRTCGADGVWSGTNPTCTPVDCGPLTDPTNGMITLSTTTFESTATYSCNTGYNIVGSVIRTCGASITSGPTGVWSPAAPVCEIVNCGSLNATANGAVDTSSGTTFMMTATYTCDTRYMLIGAMTRTCQANGMWNSSEPACEFIVLSIGGTVYTNNTALSFSLIGEGSSALTCHTELSTCCREQDNLNGGALGGWRGPGGDIPEASDASPSEGFYVTRNISTISLNRCRNEMLARGLYCCTIPRTSGTNQTFCVDVQEPSGGGDVGPIVGGVIVAVIAIVGIVVGIIVAVIFVRRMRQNRLKYAPVLKGGTLTSDTPAKPAPYTHYTRDRRDDDAIALSSVLTPKDTEPSIVEFPSDTHVTEGEEVYLRVKVGGHPPPSLTWYHDGRKVTADYATELDQDGGISFPCVETKHAGTYKLAAVNDSGSIEKQVHLSVRGENEEPPPVNKNIDLGPLPVEQLGVFVSDLHANGNLKFKDAYKTLDNGEKGHDVVVAKIPENKLCNRFGNIAVYDDNRIVLQPIPGQEDCQSDYINACYVDGYQAPRKFIATQGPIPRTVVDFWRLMWQERPPIIVMLTNLKEGNKVKCQPYWPESGKKQFGPFTVAITEQQIFADYTVRTLKVTIEGDRKFLKTTQFHFTTWPDHGVPDYATPILGFHRRVQSQHKPSKGPLLVHCSAGVGRTGTYIAIDNVLDQISAEGMVDISGTIVRARNQRMKMVQTQDQYVFIHDAILESVTCGDTQISAGDLRRQILNMSSVAPGKTVSGFQYQFQILEQVSPNPNEINSSAALESMDKNRGKKYLPADNSRVFLKGEQPDYIHAVFAHGYKHQKAYIIAQNPLDSTVRNFWKVIYSRKCAAVVMLTPLSENGQEACSQYWPESGNVISFGEFTIDNLGEETNTGFVMRQLSVLNEKTQKALQVIQFHITNWNSSGKCENLKTVTDVNEEVIKVQRRTGNKAIVVHCSDTATRSGMYCSVATTIDRCKTEGVVDVFQVVKALRVHKPGAVPSVDNYKDVFEALLVYLDSFDTYANF
ncbi:uncharacterized protein LOC135334783 [Halichondria panicea]|uniref:uncharacterized protein LOC135334783 n=1 Tax=Halichondria panicea TaxID=6063 RepID=UPI00312BAB29